MEPWISDEVLHTGAEAVVTSGTWFGADAIKKQRTERKWRHPDLDAQLTKKRLQNEIKLIICFHCNLRGKYLFSLFKFDMFFLFVYFFSIRHVFS